MVEYEELEEEAKLGLTDLFFFCNFFVGLTLDEQPHREMCDLIQGAETDPSKPYTILVVPRGTYKSSIARAAVTWKLLRQFYLHANPYHRIVISSATLALGKAWLSAIEGTWRSGGKGGRITTYYGALWRNRDMKGNGSKREDGLVWGPRCDSGEIAEVVEPSVFIGSMRRITTGAHADEAMVDDLNNKENTRTDHQIKQTHTYYQLLYPILGTTDRGGNPTKITMLCTPWHDNDVRGMIIREERQKADHNPSYVSRWSILQRGAVLEDGAPFFPAKYPVSRLDELRSAMGSREFAANYDCDPVGNAGFVDEELIRFRARETFPELLYGRINVDPNQHRDALDVGCYAAIVVTAYDKYGKMYVLDAIGSREWGTAEFINALFDVQAKYPYMIFMEDSHMTHFAHAVSLEEMERSKEARERVSLRIAYVPVDYKSSKYERWQRIQPRFRAGSIVFSDDIAPDIKTEIKEELVRGHAARFKDFLDALAMAENGMKPKYRKDGAPEPAAPRGTRQTQSNPAVLTFADVIGSQFRKVM